MIIVSHPTGNANVRAAVKGIRQAGLLSYFYTTIAIFPSDILYKLSNKGVFSELLRRSYDQELHNYTKITPWIEALRLLAKKLKLTNLTKHETGIFSVDSVYRSLDKNVASLVNKQDVNAIYAYEDGALHSFEAARNRGIKCYYDLPIGYWRSARNLLEIEKERWPAWSPTLGSFKDSEQKLMRKDEEIKMADHIFVASQFTADSLKDFPDKLPPVNVIPYGFPAVKMPREYKKSFPRKIKILFVGGLSQRKGIADIFYMADKLNSKIELTIVGNKVVDLPVLNQNLKKHKWIPSISHQGVLDLMKFHDILVFPSLFEGFGLVITEAMSQGTPVITTERTAGPDLIDNDYNGWIIKAGDRDELLIAVEKVLLNPEKIEQAGKAAQETAKQRPWDVYGRECAHQIKMTI